jgi:toxin ParE1/3/4
MKQFRVSEAASSDLRGIWLCIGPDNPEAASKLVRAIVSRFPRLASMPEMGRRRDELSEGLRSFPVSRYVIFYQLTENGIEIIRILHGARDLPAMFE